MAEAVGSLRVDVSANVAQISGDMRAIRGVIQSNTAGIQSALSKMNASSMASAAAIGTIRTGAMALGAVMAGAFSRQMLEAAANIGNMATRLGLSTDSMQLWMYAARTVGASTEDVTKIFEKLNEKLGEVSETATPTSLALSRIGLTVAQLRGLNPDEQMRLIADGLSRVADQSQRAAIAGELLGGKSDDFLGILMKGRAGIEALADEMKRFGLVLSSETIKKAQDANREFQIIETLTGNAGKSLTADMLPALKALRELLTDPGFQSAMRGFGSMLGLAAEGIGYAFKGIRMALNAPDILMAAGRVGDLTQELARAKENLDRLVAAGTPSDDAVRAYESVAARLAEAKAKLEEVSSFESKAPPVMPEINKAAIGGFDAKKAEEVAKAARQLSYDFQKLQGDFKGLAEGFPDLAYGLGIFGENARRAYVNTGELTGRLRMLNDLQLAVNASRLKDEMRTPLEKYNDEIAKLNTLMQSGIVTQETYNRKLYELKEGLIQAGGAGISFTNMANDMASAFSNSLESMITKGASWRDAMLGFIRDIAAAVARNAIIKPLANSLTNSLGGPSGLLQNLTNANGNAFSQGRLMAFANGGVVGGPTMFPMRGGLGLMGEAGPEAIMPLERGADGRLGVASRGGGGSVINIDARGSDAGVVDRIMAAMATVEKGRPNSVSTLQSYRKRFPTR